MAQLHNLLVISDLHLGEDLGNVSETVRLHGVQTDGALSSFLAYYTLSREGDLPWKLVINGDMIDFLSVAVLPEDLGVEGDEQESIYGLGTTEAVAVAKLERVIIRHTEFFDGLARFLDAGNEVHIITGNHDAELHFEAVRGHFREVLELRSTTDISKSLAFHPWFFLESGFAYLEHGHQYDPFCSFDHPLSPEDLNNPNVLEENLGTAAMRYLGNHLPVDPDATNDLSFFEYLHLLANSQGDVANQFVMGYASLVRVLVHQWWSRIRNPSAFLRRKENRRRKMDELALITGLDRKLLERLAKLRRPPVFVGLLQLIRSVMLGRLLSAMLLPPLLFFGFLAGVLVSFKTGLLGMGLVFIAFIALQLWLMLSRDNVDPTESMGKTAAKISKLVRAPIVVFGHSHVPLVRHLGQRGWYFNTGSWAGGSERTSAFTHLILIRGRNDVQASLCRWQKEESRTLRSESTRTTRPHRIGGSTGY